MKFTICGQQAKIVQTHNKCPIFHVNIWKCIFRKTNICVMFLFKKKVNEEKQIEKNTGSRLMAAILKMAAFFKMHKSECFCVIVNRLKGLKIFSAVQDQFI